MMLCAKFGWNWIRGVFNSINACSLLRCYLPLGKGGVLQLKKLESFFIQGVLRQLWLKLSQWFWRKRFLNFVNIIVILLLSPVGKVLPSIYRNFNLFQPRMHCVKFGSNSLCGSWEEGEKLTDGRQTTGGQSSLLELSNSVQNHPLVERSLTLLKINLLLVLQNHFISRNSFSSLELKTLKFF